MHTLAEKSNICNTLKKRKKKRKKRAWIHCIKIILDTHDGLFETVSANLDIMISKKLASKSGKIPKVFIS
jgi:hypothetical protein